MTDICFVDVRITDILENMMFSNFMVANSRATYRRHNTGREMMINHQGVLPRFLELDDDALAAKTFDITHIADPCLYFYFEEDILFMSQDSDD